ncbi:sugar phosphate isomerase/epimerase [Microbacterium sp. UCD-TDU]|uniref:sugar phosphate isomerase/epimerase family protein n=1 Tax=Microbacterium sp. UCD-TDU TaxID=1247714 RepID=UPI0003493551|nr:sugar phosphate isomerase/epimerase [Microbacterium sp. UCD-TDU]EYT61405.1 xylose isomerase [Microbacterium sp. UCD-TDU]
MTIRTSLQLFTIKDELEADLESSLAAVAARGFTAVEPYDFVRRAEPLAAALTAAGLVAPSGHAFLASSSFVNPDGSGTTVPVPTPAEVFAAAKVLGMDTVIDPYTEPARWETVEQIEETARLLNEAAEVGAGVGVRVGYHNHAHELEAVFDGVTGLEILAGLLDERVVLEVDLYWVARGGVDPVALLGRLGSRVIAVHAKDGTLDPALAGAYPPADQLPAGEGSVPLVAAIAAAPALELAIVEFDHYEGDLFDAIERSRVYLDEKVAG